MPMEYMCFFTCVRISNSCGSTCKVNSFLNYNIPGSNSAARFMLFNACCHMTHKKKAYAHVISVPINEGEKNRSREFWGVFYRLITAICTQRV